MKLIIINEKAFATHTDDQEIGLNHYPLASDILLTDDGIPNPLGQPEERGEDGEIITPAIPPMTRDEIIALMSDEQLAASELYINGVTNDSVTASNFMAINGDDTESKALMARVQTAATKYGVSISTILGKLQ